MATVNVREILSKALADGRIEADELRMPKNRRDFEKYLKAFGLEKLKSERLASLSDSQDERAPLLAQIQQKFPEINGQGAALLDYLRLSARQLEAKSSWWERIKSFPKMALKATWRTMKANAMLTTAVVGTLVIGGLVAYHGGYATPAINWVKNKILALMSSGAVAKAIQTGKDVVAAGGAKLKEGVEAAKEFGGAAIERGSEAVKDLGGAAAEATKGGAENLPTPPSTTLPLPSSPTPIPTTAPSFEATQDIIDALNRSG